MNYGRYNDDFDEHGPSRSFGADHVDDADEPDGDEEEAPRTALARSSSRSEGGGSGRDRGGRMSERESELMSMTRRDPVREAKDLYRTSIDDMKNFLSERETAEPMHSVSGIAVTGLEIAAGAGIAAFLAQRFRQAGAVVPVGVTMAVLGLIASQFNMVGKLSPDLRNVSFGAGASAIALWAAGRGIIATEAAAPAGQPATGGVTSPQPHAQPHAQPQPFVPQPPQQPFVPQPSQQQFVPRFPMPVVTPFGRPPANAPPQFTMLRGEASSSPMVAMSMADFQNLVARRVA